MGTSAKIMDFIRNGKRYSWSSVLIILVSDEFDFKRGGIYNEKNGTPIPIDFPSFCVSFINLLLVTPSQNYTSSVVFISRNLKLVTFICFLV